MRDKPPFARGNCFVAAARGIAIGLRDERNLLIHATATIAVVAAGVWLRVSLLEAAALTLCVAGVWTAELFNTALERLARAIDREENPLLRDALDLSAGAVLSAAIGAAVAGGLILLVKVAA